MDEQLRLGKDYKFIPVTSLFSGDFHEVTSDILAFTIQVVNICFIGNENHWILIDAGMPKSHQKSFRLQKKGSVILNQRLSS